MDLVSDLLNLVVAQGQKYGSFSKNRTYNDLVSNTPSEAPNLMPYN